MTDMNSKLNRIIRLSIQAILLLLLAMYMVSGLGITEARTIETLSLGLLTKPVAFELHNNLLLPFIIFLILHIAYKPISRAMFKSTK
jgi:hypothetical protein